MLMTIFPALANRSLRSGGQTVGEWIQKPMMNIAEMGVYGVMGKELIGINSPKMIKVRNWDEFKDSATNELTNTIGYFGLGAAISKVFNVAFKGLETATDFQKKSKMMGKSLAMCLTLGSFIWSVPFIRNYVTAVRTGTTKFTRLIGETDLLSSQTPEEFRREKKRFLNTVLAVFGSGLLASAAVLGGTRRVMKRGSLKAPDWLKKVGESLTFKDGNFKNMNSHHAAWFWGLPCYLGLIHASREPHEKVEQGIKAVNFFTMFFAVPAVIRRVFLRPKFYPQQLLNRFKQTSEHFLTGSPKRSEQVNFSYANLVGELDNNPKMAHLKPLRGNILKNWGMQEALAYVGSTVALFVSNYIANALSIHVTGKRVAKHEKQWATWQYQAMDRRTEWRSPQVRSFNDFVNS